MIRINLLERRETAAPKPAAPKVNVGLYDFAMVAIIACGVLFVGWKWYSLDHREAQLKADIAAADQELADLNKVLKTMDEHQNKKKALEHRVDLISNLKRRQTVPVLLLDMLSRQVPDFLWLENLDERSGAISLRGKATTYNAVSNFYNNLRDSNYFADVMLGATSKATEGVSFTLSCRFAPPMPPAGAAGEQTAAAGANAPPRG